MHLVSEATSGQTKRDIGLLSERAQTMGREKLCQKAAFPGRICTDTESSQVPFVSLGFQNFEVLSFCSHLPQIFSLAADAILRLLYGVQHPVKALLSEAIIC